MISDVEPIDLDQAKRLADLIETIPPVFVNSMMIYGCGNYVKVVLCENFNNKMNQRGVFVMPVEDFEKFIRHSAERMKEQIETLAAEVFPHPTVGVKQ